MPEDIKGELVLPQKPQMQILNRQDVLDLGSIFRGSTKSLKFAIKNCGEEILKASFSTTENWVSVVPSITELNKGEICEIEVKAKPEDIRPGRQKGTLIIKSNDLLEETKTIYILAQIQEATKSIELYPDYIELGIIWQQKAKTVKVEVKNTLNPSEIVSVDVEVNPDASWLSYELITGHKNQSYINFKINSHKLSPGDYSTIVRVREMFSPDSFPLDLPISFTISEERPRITTKLNKSETRENVGNFIKKLVYQEQEQDDIIYTDQKTYSTNQIAYIVIPIVILIIVIIGIIVFSK